MIMYISDSIVKSCSELYQQQTYEYHYRLIFALKRRINHLISRNILSLSYISDNRLELFLCLACLLLPRYLLLE